MANWCDNIILFAGDPEKIAHLLELFFEQAEPDMHQMPGFVTAENWAMIDMEFYNNGRIYYRTRWEPNLEALQQIADHFDVGFVNRYAEPDMFIWGEAIYQNGQGRDIRLELSDYQRCHYNTEFKCFMCNGKSYKSDYQAFEEMLDDKIRAAGPMQNSQEQNMITR